MIFNDQDRTSADIAISKFAPIGETVQMAMLDFAATNNFEIDVRAVVLEPFYYNGYKILDVGDVFIGKGAPGKTRDRMLVTFSKLKLSYPESDRGKTLQIQAIAQDVDGTVGIRGYQVGSVVLQSITPVLLETAAAFIEVFKDRSIAAFIPSRVSVASLNADTNNGASRSSQLADAGYRAIQGGLEKISDLVAQDVEENKPYLIVPAGTKFRAYLQNFIDVSKAEYGQ